jgi:hypothetical protein
MPDTLVPGGTSIEAAAEEAAADLPGNRDLPRQ